MNKCYKFGDCMISTFLCVHILWLNHTSSTTVISPYFKPIKQQYLKYDYQQFYNH